MAQGSQLGLNDNLLGLLGQKHERQKDRNLNAAIADRQFMDKSKDRLLSKILSDDKIKSTEKQANQAFELKK